MAPEEGERGTVLVIVEGQLFALLIFFQEGPEGFMEKQGDMVLREKGYNGLVVHVVVADGVGGDDGEFHGDVFCFSINRGGRGGGSGVWRRGALFSSLVSLIYLLSVRFKKEAICL